MGGASLDREELREVPHWIEKNIEKNYGRCLTG
jgi:hypothetical protein